MLKNKALSIIRKTREDYNIISKEWDVSRSEPSPWKIRYLKLIKKGDKLLDLGCGNGMIVPFSLNKGANYTGIDISGKLIKIAKKRYQQEIKNKHVNFYTGDILKLPFKKDSFDKIISFSVFHHIPSGFLRIKVLKEIKRVLKPGGTAIVSVWNLYQPSVFEKYKIKEQLQKMPVEFEKGDVFVPWKATAGKIILRYLHIFDKDELKNLAQKSGFIKIKIEFRNMKGNIKKNGEDLSLLLKK